jgi:hypothetical protein
MNAAELSRIIELDLACNASTLSWHGRPVAECLCPPERQVFLDSFNNNEPLHLWLVFNESLNTEEGYKVVYAENEELFGLAVPGTDTPVFIGIYGSFVETLNSM